MCSSFIMSYLLCLIFFFFKQKTAYEMRISDWSSDVCSFDLRVMLTMAAAASTVAALASAVLISWALQDVASGAIFGDVILGASALTFDVTRGRTAARVAATATDWTATRLTLDAMGGAAAICDVNGRLVGRSEAHTAELTSLMRYPYAVFCVK